MHEDHAAGHERLVEHLLERDHHDLGRQDEVGADRPRDGGGLGVGALERHRHVVVVVVVAQGVDDLVGALVGEEAATEHQDDLDHRRRDRAQQQRHREDDQDLVAQRAEGDALDDRQLTVGGQPTDVGRGDRGVVDHDAGGLHARPAGCGQRHVVHRRRGQLGQRRDVIEQSDQTACHRPSLVIRESKQRSNADRCDSRRAVHQGRDGDAPAWRRHWGNPRRCHPLRSAAEARMPRETTAATTRTTTATATTRRPTAIESVNALTAS